VVQAFFLGQRGGQALAEVLTGAVNPSGRLPVSIPRDAGALPTTYLSVPLARRSEVSSVDPTPAYPFGHGLGYTTVDWSQAAVLDPTGQPHTGEEPAVWPVDGAAEVAITVRNTGSRDGTEVVQLYLHDPVAQVTRPVERLVGYARVALAAGEAARVTFRVPADLASFTGLRGHRIVEPGAVQLRFGRSSGVVAAALELRLTGPERQVGHRRELLSSVRVEPHPAPAERG
jgi:beta-glucosidase